MVAPIGGLHHSHESFASNKILPIIIKDESRKWRRKNKRQKFIETHLKDLWHIQKQISDRQQVLTDEANFARMSMSRFSSKNDGAKVMISKACTCI